MKKGCFWIFLFPLTLLAQNNAVYTIQIGTFVEPQLSEFNFLQPLGYLYNEPFGNNFSKVFLGEFSSESAATDVLQQVRQKGYGAFLTPKPINGISTTVVQFATEKIGIPINWSKFSQVGKCYALLTDPNRVKIVTGPFANETTARQRVAAIQAMGYQDAFVKNVNSDLLHEVDAFEMGIAYVKKDLNTAVDIILNEPTPTAYETEIPVIKGANVQPSTVGKMAPEIRPLIKRTSALDLQKLLKANQYFSGSLDGFYGKATAAGYEIFQQQNKQFQKFEVLSQVNLTKESPETSAFQTTINNLLVNPNQRLVKLVKMNQPLAKAYRAYLLMTNNGNITEINQLMNRAIKNTFADKKIKNAPPFDFNAAYSYEELEQFILHLRYLHAAPVNEQYAIPCWLFEQHPEESLAAFKTKSKFASFANTNISACKGFDQWKPIQILRTMIEELAPTDLSEAQLDRQATLTTARNFQYLFPEKQTKEEKKEIDQWLRTFWDDLGKNAPSYPVLAKNLTALKIIFFQSQVLLEDFYMNEGFTPDAAEGLALSVLKTYVEVPLEVYL
ncbi:MAG: hypothetical protein AAF960_08885 [Bacteroidota bacterium]